MERSVIPAGKSKLTLHAVKAGLVAQIGGLAPIFDHLFDLRNGHGPGFVELVPRPFDGQVDVAGADRIGVQILVALPSGMGQLRHDERAVRFGGVGHLLELGDPAVVVVDQNGVPIGLDRIVSKHCVAADDDPDIALSPPSIQVNVLGAGHAPGGLDVEVSRGMGKGMGALTISSPSWFQWHSLSVMGALRNRFFAVRPENANVIGSLRTETSTCSDFARRWPRADWTLVFSAEFLSAVGGALKVAVSYSILC